MDCFCLLVATNRLSPCPTSFPFFPLHKHSLIAIVGPVSVNNIFGGFGRKGGGPHSSACLWGHSRRRGFSCHVGGGCVGVGPPLLYINNRWV
jgi:hypothetical protein